MGLPKGRTNNPEGRPPRAPEQMRALLLGKRKVAASGCWEWVGKVNEWGYPQISWNGRHTLVSRVAAAIWLGFSLDDSNRVCHSCDNPRCFNPKHLWLGTDGDNSRDCTDKARQFQQRKTHCAQGHAFTPENTSIRVAKGKTGIGYERRCKTCHRDQERRRRGS